MRRSRVVAVLAACAGVLLACAAREDVTPAIAVQPGAAARALALMGHGGPNDPLAGAATSEDAGATVSAEKPRGKIVFSCLEARGAYKALSRVPCAVTIVGVGAPPGQESDLVAERGNVAIAIAPGK